MKRLLALGLVLLSTCLFATAKDRPVTTVALVSDPHIMVGTNGHAGTYLRHFEEAIAQVNKASVDFVLITGDLANGGKVDEWREFLSHIKEFKAPVFYVPGNHDVGHKFNSGKTNGTITVERVKTYERLMGPSFFAKDVHGVRIVGLNASLFGSGFERELEQQKFLEAELAQTTDMPRLIFMHYPLFVATADESGGGYWNVEPKPRRELLSLFKKAHVNAVLTGHLHRSLEKEYEGILLLGTTATSFSIGRTPHQEGWTLVTLPKNAPIKFERMKLEAK